MSKPSSSISHSKVKAIKRSSLSLSDSQLTLAKIFISHKLTPKFLPFSIICWTGLLNKAVEAAGHTQVKLKREVKEMSNSSVTVAGVGSRSPPGFTMSQWHELEHQVLIFKCLNAGLPVPPSLLLPIRKSFQLLSPGFLHPSNCKLQKQKTSWLYLFYVSLFCPFC